MKKFLFGIAALALFASPALAGNTVVFSPVTGDVNLPISPPTNAGATAGKLDNTDIGQTTPAKVSASQVQLDTGTKTATATGTTTATATLNKMAGKITSASLTTAAGGTWVLTLTDSSIAAADQVLASVATAGTGMPMVANVVPAAGSVVITVQNIHASAAFNNTIVLSFAVLKN